MVQDEHRQLDYRNKKDDKPNPSIGLMVAVALGGALAGIVIGYFSSVFLGLWLFPGSNVAPLPFLFTLCPAVTAATPILLLWLVWRAHRRSKWRP